MHTAPPLWLSLLWTISTIVIWVDVVLAVIAALFLWRAIKSRDWSFIWVSLKYFGDYEKKRSESYHKRAARYYRIFEIIFTIVKFIYWFTVGMVVANIILTVVYTIQNL